MAEERVRIGKDFYHVPAVKAGNGWLRLEKGDFARVRYDSTKKKLELTRNESGKRKRNYFNVEDYARANEVARNANKIGAQAGAGFGSLRKEEEEALKIWRNYVEQEVAAGKTPCNLAEIMRDIIERERTKDETPLLTEVIFKFIEEKDATAGLSSAYRARLKRRLEALGKYFKDARIGELDETKIKCAIMKLAKGKNGNPPSPKTQKHWIELVKEVFNWFYRRENAKRRATEKLTNPLEILASPKIIKTKEPEILTVEQARVLLDDLWKNDLSLLPAVAVQMFCGVRNAEMLRLRWKDMKDGEFHLSCSITKTKIARAVPVSENLKAWFDAYFVARGSVPAPEELIFPFNDTPEKELAKLSDIARAARIEADYHARSMSYSRAILASERRIGFKKPKNAFRHTAASCLSVIVGQTRAADYCGHSIRTQGVNYRGLVSRQDANDYFNIMPPTSDGKAIPFDRSGMKSKEGGEKSSICEPAA